MAVTCRTCNQTFQNIAEVADHIGDTNKGLQGEWTGFSTDKPTQQDNEQLTDAIRGFSHVNYVNERGQILPTTQLSTLLMAGVDWCPKCTSQTSFRTNYRLYEHIINEHDKDHPMWEIAMQIKKEAEELEKKVVLGYLLIFNFLNK